MAHGALGARLSCLLELNVIYTAEERKLNRDEQSAAICVDVLKMGAGMNP